MYLPFYIVDVFAKTKYTGNQLAVIPDAGELSDASMQEIAREMHFSETTFIRSSGTNDNSYDVRIFTPEHEVPFAGHPVLGTAYIIQTRTIRKPVAGITINLAAGRIPVSFTYKNGIPTYLWMQQNPPVFTRTFPPAGIARVLSIPEHTIDTRFPIEEVSTGLPFIIVPIRTRQALSGAKINRKAYERLINSTDAKAIFIFCPDPNHPENTFAARMFADYYGVPEDPATGSANGCLAGYLIHNRYFGDSPVDIRVEQGYEIHRPSLICSKAELRGNIIDVFVGGNVVMVAEGKLI
jgi:trans-2,3-dihydro-3-hydroxyanthranilate isomerase